MLLCTTEGDAEREEQYLTLLRAKQVDGALVDGLRLPPDRIAAFVKDGFPIVCLDRDVDSDSIPLVQVDNRLGGRLATEHLIGLGHSRDRTRRPAPTSWASATSGSRATGKRWSTPAIEADPRLVAEGQLHGGGRVRGSACGCSRRSPAVTAIFAANDLSALGVVARTRGKRPPRARRRLGRRLRRPSALRVHLHRR